MWYRGVMVDESHPMTIRLSDARYERLRREAYERHIPMNTIINEALDGHFAEQPEIRKKQS